MTGTDLRDSGTSSVSANTPEWWRAAADLAIAQCAATLVPFGADEVRAIAGDPPNHPNAMGARFLAAARAGIIRRVGYEPSKRASLHAHPVARWVGVEK